jgi:hypothetical protein
VTFETTLLAQNVGLALPVTQEAMLHGCYNAILKKFAGKATKISPKLSLRRVLGENQGLLIE